MMGIVTVLWAIVGYSLAFGPGNASSAASITCSCTTSACAQCRLRSHHPRTDLHDLSADVRDHHPGAYLRSLRRANEVQRDVLFLTLWAIVVYFPMAHMVWGKGGLLNASRAARFPVSISPAARSSTSLPGSRRWCAPSIWASESGIPTSRCRRTSSCSASSAPACCGSGGSASTRAVRSPPDRSGHQRLRRTHFATAAAAIGWMFAEWMPQRQTQRSGRDLRRGRGPGRHHAGLGIRETHARPAHRLYCRASSAS